MHENDRNEITVRCKKKKKLYFRKEKRTHKSCFHQKQTRHICLKMIQLYIILDFCHVVQIISFANYYLFLKRKRKTIKFAFIKSRLNIYGIVPT